MIPIPRIGILQYGNMALCLINEDIEIRYPGRVFEIRRIKMNNWVLYVILYLILSTVFTQFYKISTKNLKNAGALTVVLEMIGVITALVICPLFEMKFPTDIKTWILLGLSIIFYAISDRINTTVRSGIEASTFNILLQLSTTFMILAGFIFFKEEFVLHQFIGAILIIVSNIFLFYKKGEFKINRYIGLSLIANISFTIALFLDVNISNYFNLPIYVALTLGIPSILIAIVERIRFSEIKSEFKNGDKKAIWITGICWSLMIVVQLRAYQIGNVSIVAAISALTVMTNVIVGYVFLKERDNLLRKIIAGILIVLSIVLIKR